jgi:hypothetical protein
VGEAHGTWRVVGKGALELNVGDFDTHVIMRNASFELEIDSYVEVIPDFARVYVIPGGVTRYRCGGDLLTVGWTGGEPVRWSRLGEQNAKSPKGSHKP